MSRSDLSQATPTPPATPEARPIAASRASQPRGGHNEPELVAIAARTLEERLAVHYVLVGRIEGARLAFAGHTVTLDIAEVSAGAADALSAELDGAHLDDAPARPEDAETVARHPHHRAPRHAPQPAAGQADQR